jgi:hypothetical protein
MKLELLRQKSLEDLKLSDELDRDAQDLPRKKAQWSEWLTQFGIDYKRAWWKVKQKKKEKFEYYFTNYTITLDRRDILDIYMPGDDDIIELQKQLEVHHQKVELCERTIRGLNSMGFDIKNVIEFRKLMSGIV